MRINDLHAMAAKQESLKKQMLEVVETEKMLVERQKEKNRENVNITHSKIYPVLIYHLSMSVLNNKVD